MKHVKLFENFDQYEFGRIYKDLEVRCGDIRKLAIHISNDDIDIIKSNFGDKYYVSPQLILCTGSNEITGVIVTPSTKPRIMNCVYILYMGDYTYGVIYYEKTESIRGVREELTKLFVCDGMDDVIKCLHENLWEIEN